uniref:Putative secreted protein n=1 Tax=Anopheles marajoara TaxID=58244 RepID=A0A2M4CEY0_9DIPT
MLIRILLQLVQLPTERSHYIVSCAPLPFDGRLLSANELRTRGRTTIRWGLVQTMAQTIGATVCTASPRINR